MGDHQSDDADRRAARRRPWRATASCELGGRGSQRTLFGQLLNLSAAGCQLLWKGPLVDDIEVFLTLLDERKDAIAALPTTIAWQRREGPQATRVGLRFARPLDERLLARLEGNSAGSPRR